MPKANKPRAFYAVAKGHSPGIYETWDECETQVKNFQGAKHKKFYNLTEAEGWIKANNPDAVIDTTSIAASTSATSLPRFQSMQSARCSKGKERAADDAGHDATSLTRDGWRVVYCDGASKNNGKDNSVAGLGVWWGPNDSRNLAERCPGAQTNNRAELIAITRILETTPKDKTPLEIRTDSKYSIDCMKTWLPNWRRNKFRTSGGGPVKNAALIKYLEALLAERGRIGQKVILKHVYGHMGEEGNENADRLANMGCLLQEVPERDWEALEQEVLDGVYWDEQTEVVLPTVIDEEPQSAEARNQPPDVMPKPAESVSALLTAPVKPERSSFRPATAPQPPQANPSARFGDLLSEATNSPLAATTRESDLACREAAVQTMDWVHPDGLVPPNPCLTTGQYAEWNKGASRQNLPNDQKLPKSDLMPQAELNAYANCLLDDKDLVAELED